MLKTRENQLKKRQENLRQKVVVLQLFKMKYDKNSKIIGEEIIDFQNKIVKVIFKAEN